MTKADKIKRSVSTWEAAEYYGFRPNSGGYIICPFHKEKTPSLKLYREPGKGFHCFGCGCGGSVIDFVMSLYNLSFSQALLRINHDLSLGIIDRAPDSRQQTKRARELREEHRQDAARLREFELKTAQYRYLHYAKKNLAPKTTQESWHPAYIDACKNLPVLEQWFEDNPFNRRWDW